ncbi:hypothetical protein ACFVHI_28540 [Kitasatospora sp. NPDC127121]
MAVMLRVYAKCLHGTVEYANELISKRLNRNRPAPPALGPGPQLVRMR